MVDVPRNVSYSRLSDFAIEESVLAHYECLHAPQCQYFMTGLHDNYRVQDGQRDYIVRLYRNDWRSEPDILFELELLIHLRQYGAEVAQPLMTRTGEYYVKLGCPEGERLAVLFPWAPGEAPGAAITPQQSALLGAAVADLHAGSGQACLVQKRPALDIVALLEQPIKSIIDFNPPPGIFPPDYWQGLQRSLTAALAGLPFEAPYTVYCHGDINPGNFHIAGQRITLFDFDQCGYGWRAFDIGKYFSSVLTYEQYGELQQRFLAAYQQRLPLEEEERRCIPYFICVSLLWVTAIHIANINLIGHKALAAPFWQHRYALLERATAELVRLL